MASNIRSNGFGALRLALASLVIVSHSFEMLDGDRSREPMATVYPGMTLGTAAVLGFFLISGYLITGSYIANRAGFVWRRALRIYPAYLACALICILIVAPLGGGSILPLDAGSLPKALGHLVLLEAPVNPGAFATLAYPGALNGSMWTLAYEFRCYLLAAGMGLVGLYGHRAVYAVLTAGVLFLTAIVPEIHVSGPLAAVLGEPADTVMLGAAFMTGACFRLYNVKFRGIGATVCAGLGFTLMLWPPITKAAFILLGGYVLFWLALTVKWKPLLTINARNDISYGVYLYAWPVGALIIWFWRDVDPATLMILTLAGAVVLGWASWLLVEKPAMRLKSAGRLAFGRRNFLTP